MTSGYGCTDHSQLLNNHLWCCIFRRSAASDKQVKEQRSPADTAYCRHCSFSGRRSKRDCGEEQLTTSSQCCRARTALCNQSVRLFLLPGCRRTQTSCVIMASTSPAACCQPALLLQRNVSRATVAARPAI